MLAVQLKLHRWYGENRKLPLLSNVLKMFYFLHNMTAFYTTDLLSIVIGNEMPA